MSEAVTELVSLIKRGPSEGGTSDEAVIRSFAEWRGKMLRLIESIEENK